MTIATAQPITSADPAAIEATGRAMALVVGLAIFTLVLVTGFLIIIARRRARARAAARVPDRPVDTRDAWAESAKRMPTPEAPDDTRAANPNDDTSEWDSPYTNGSPHSEPDDDPEDEDDPRGPFQ